jgi:hypothetical protein
MEELCSLYVLGELSAAEKRELDKHLHECRDCRALLQDFEQIVLVDLTSIAAKSAGEQSSPEFRLHNPERVLASIVQPVDQIPAVPPIRPAPTTPQPPRLQQSAPWMLPNSLTRWVMSSATLLALLAVGAAVHMRRPGRSSEPQSSAMLDQIQQTAAAWKLKAESAETQQRLSVDELNRSQEKNAAISASLAALQTSYGDLEQKQLVLEHKLADETASLQQQQSELKVTQASLDQERQHVGTLTAQLQDVNSEALKARENLAHLRQVADVSAAPISPPEPHVTDADAREVFGARDLHIVDVYDVDHSGNTRRTYGRVYYVNRNLLLFYAFDLQDKKHNRKAAGFQAWGFRQPNSSKPENLGLFYIDDASQRLIPSS